MTALAPVDHAPSVMQLLRHTAADVLQMDDDATTELLALADKVEAEPATLALECEIGAAIENLEEPGTVVQRNGQWLIKRHGFWEAYRPKPCLSDLSAAAELEPGDAREVMIRLLHNGGTHVRITLADGRVAECEAIDRDLSEARARTACALRALALR